MYLLIGNWGIDTCFNDVQSSKRESPMVSTEDGITIDSREEHFLKALDPMFLTLWGIKICFIFLHPSKALASMFLTSAGIWKNCILSQFWKQPSLICSNDDSMVICSNEVHPLKA